MGRIERGSSHCKGRLLRLQDEISFECHPDLECFTQCCRDVNIFLTPYDVVRMKASLGIRSWEFLSRYTMTLLPPKPGLPVVALKMRDDVIRSCPFVTQQGCSIYEARPWSCRMYPLDVAEHGEGFRLLADASLCRGLKAKRRLKVDQYLHTQGLQPYGVWNELMARFTTHPRLSVERIENPKIKEMFRMALYDVDTFRRFVFESRFLEIFEVDPLTRDRISGDDLELLSFAFRWLEFGLLDGKTLRIRQDLIKKVKDKGTTP
jgi:hypothetical protein